MIIGTAASRFESQFNRCIDYSGLADDSNV
jgi:hypothetical protein